MASQNEIGLDRGTSQALAEQLNALLANFQVFYINARGFHWNITGEKFFELHAKFEEIYNDLLLKVDEVAERILTIGHTPLHTFTDYVKASTIPEAGFVADGKDALRNVRDSLQTLISLERKVLELAGESGDEGTSALMSDYIREQEKGVWMYSAYLK